MTVTPPSRPGREPAPPSPAPDPDRVVVPVADFVEGRLPGVCVVSGQPATINLRVRVWALPGWGAAIGVVVWVALAVLVGVAAGPPWVPLYEVVSILLMVAALRLTRPSVPGVLPVSTGVAARVRMRRTLAFDVGIGAVLSIGLGYAALLALGGTADAVRVGDGLGLLGVLLGAVSLVMALVAARSLGVRARLIRASSGDRRVELRGVHPGFTAALQDLRRDRGGR